jgi:hypothetical protein
LLLLVRYFIGVLVANAKSLICFLKHWTVDQLGGVQPLLRVRGHGQRPVSGWLGYSASNLGDERLNHFAMQNGGQALPVGW